MIGDEFVVDDKKFYVLGFDKDDNCVDISLFDPVKHEGRIKVDEDIARMYCPNFLELLDKKNVSIVVVPSSTVSWADLGLDYSGG